MSNIFEIDGEIEDNEEEGQSDPQGSENAGQPTDLPSEPIHFDLDGEPEEGEPKVPGHGDDDEAAHESTETPWYEKYLDDEEVQEQDTEDNHAEKEDLAISSQTKGTESTEGTGVQQEGPGPEPNRVDDLPEEDENLDLPTVDEITDEEIEEVLAELETANLELESQQEDDEQDEIDKEKDNDWEETPAKGETFDDIFPPVKRTRVGLTTWVFVVLFLITLTGLFYYQFYDGHQVHFTLSHMSKAGMSRIDSIGQSYKEKLAELENQQRIIADLREKIKELHERNHELLSDSTRTTNLAVIPSGETASTGSIDFRNGTYYQVQVMALQEYHPDFGGSQFSFYVDREEGYSKMLIGAMQEEAKAKVLYDKLRKAGFADAFIVKKVNGKRVEYNPFP